MNCTNCGAPMELHESRRFFRCAHCGTVRVPDPAPGDVSILGVEREAPSCPACKTPLAAATLGDRAVHYCERCRGLLLPRATFVDVIQSRRASATSEPREPGPLDKRDLQREVGCPRCRARMSTHPYYGPGRVIIDTCDACNLVWLDTGELDRIVDAPGRDRGSSLRGGEGAWRTEQEPDLRSRERRRPPTRIDLLDLVFGDDD